MKQVSKSFLLLLTFSIVGIVLISGCSNPEVTAAKVYMQQNNYEKAIERSLKAVEQNPSDAEAYFILGQAYGQKSMYKEMNDSFNKSLEISPKFSTDIEAQQIKFWQNLFVSGVSSIKQNKLELALEQFNLAIKILPNRTEAYKNLAYTYSQLDDDSSAIQVYKEALKIDPDDLEVQTSLGIFYYRVKDYQKAIEVLDSVFQKAEPGSKEYTDALYHLCYSYDLTDQSDKAIETYQIALGMSPDDKDLIFNLGRLYFMQENYEKAIEYFNLVLQQDPNDFEANMNIGNAKLKMEKWEEAVPFLEKTVETKPDNINAWEFLGVAYVRAGQTEKGKEAFDKAESLKEAQ